MKASLLLLVSLLCLTSAYSFFTANTFKASNTCCSKCPQGLPGPQTPAKLKDIVATAVVKQWSLSYFISRLQTFPAVYFTELLDSIQKMDSSVKSGSSSCGGRISSQVPNEYLPPQLINTLYDTIISAYNVNPSKLDPSYAQSMSELLTSLQDQFNNNFGLPIDITENNSFISYYQDGSGDFTTGVVSSNALASTLASSVINSADPLLTSQISKKFHERASSVFKDKIILIEPRDIDVAFQIGNSPVVTLDFNQFQQSRPLNLGFGNFSLYIDGVNGNPFGPSVNTRLLQTSINGFTAKAKQGRQLKCEESVEPSLSASDSINAKLTGSLMAGYAYCFYPNISSSMKATCMGSCDRLC